MVGATLGSLDNVTMSAHLDREDTVNVKRSIVSSAALAIAFEAMAGGPVGATMPSPKSLQKDLLTSSYAAKVGFTEVAEQASSTSKTGVKSCPNGAQEAFEDPTSGTAMQVQLLACTSVKAATALVASASETGTSVSAPLPKNLGPAAVERSGTNSTYGVYWRHGSLVEFVTLDNNLSTTTTTTTTTTVPSLPLTPGQQQLLSNAALEQNKRH
jgi:hypothetical protein